jgi:hypothetical protein
VKSLLLFFIKHRNVAADPNKGLEEEKIDCVFVTSDSNRLMSFPICLVILD